MNKKAISPVVATALLLVVAVVAVVGFQTWFASYQSSVEAQVEDQAETGVALQSERVESDEDNTTVYLSFASDVDEITLDVDGTQCYSSDNGDEYSGLEDISCTDEGFNHDEISEGDQVELLIEGDDQVYSFTEIVR